MASRRECAFISFSWTGRPRNSRATQWNVRSLQGSSLAKSGMSHSPLISKDAVYYCHICNHSLVAWVLSRRSIRTETFFWPIKTYLDANSKCLLRAWYRPLAYFLALETLTWNMFSISRFCGYRFYVFLDWLRLHLFVPSSVLELRYFARFKLHVIMFSENVGTGKEGGRTYGRKLRS